MKNTRDYRIEIRLNKTEYDMLCNYANTYLSCPASFPFFV